MRFVVLAAAVLSLATTAVAQEPAQKPKQLLLISFDGGGSNALWQRSRDFARAHNARFTYFLSCSLVTKGPVMPEVKDGLVRFGLPLIPEGPAQRPIIAMDYNLFIRHSAGVENPSRSTQFEERAYAAFRSAFDKQYDGNRIPLQIGLHFVEMNGGAYWRAMERLVADVCRMRDVECVTYERAIEILHHQKPDETRSGL